MAKLAWAFAALDYAPCTSFTTRVRQRCETEAWCAQGDLDALRQLHQWQLWYVENSCPPPLSSRVSGLCRDAFHTISRDAAGTDGGAPRTARPSDTTRHSGRRISAAQGEVTNSLRALGLQPAIEVLSRSGYSFDATVQWRGVSVGVEVDGPSHFSRARTPTAATRLKHRQLRRLGWRLCSIPWWEWAKCPKQQRPQLLRAALDGCLEETANAAGPRCEVEVRWPWEGEDEPSRPGRRIEGPNHATPGA